jgi:hypothetical protein
MHKAAHPLGNMDSSNPHPQRGWWLHNHGGLCHSSYVDKYHTIALRWGFRWWGYRRYLVPKQHWIITTGWASLYMGKGELGMHYDGT